MSEGPGNTRREVVRHAGGAAVLATVGALLGGRTMLAQAGTPTPDDSDPEVALGQYAVVRTWTVKPDESAEELAALVSEGFVPILRNTPGFRQYTTVWNDTSRQWSAITVFVDKAGADASTVAAQEWAAANVADYVGSDPAVIDGQIFVYAEAFPPANG